jgi:hypothetical protein
MNPDEYANIHNREEALAYVNEHMPRMIREGYADILARKHQNLDVLKAKAIKKHTEDLKKLKDSLFFGSSPQTNEVIMRYNLLIELWKQFDADESLRFALRGEDYPLLNEIERVYNAGYISFNFGDQ